MVLVHYHPDVWQGWASYLEDETTEFENLAVSWATNTSLPSWLTGSYVSPLKSRLWFENNKN
jgi:hypothetical protein